MGVGPSSEGPIKNSKFFMWGRLLLLPDPHKNLYILENSGQYIIVMWPWVVENPLTFVSRKLETIIAQNWKVIYSVITDGMQVWQLHSLFKSLFTPIN